MTQTYLFLTKSHFYLIHLFIFRLRNDRIRVAACNCNPCKSFLSPQNIRSPSWLLLFVCLFVYSLQRQPVQQISIFSKRMPLFVVFVSLSLKAHCSHWLMTDADVAQIIRSADELSLILILMLMLMLIL